jgi:hypothetical protein
LREKRDLVEEKIIERQKERSSVVVVVFVSVVFHGVSFPVFQSFLGFWVSSCVLHHPLFLNPISSSPKFLFPWQEVEKFLLPAAVKISHGVVVVGGNTNFKALRYVVFLKPLLTLCFLFSYLSFVVCLYVCFFLVFYLELFFSSLLFP